MHASTHTQINTRKTKTKLTQDYNYMPITLFYPVPLSRYVEILL